MKEKFSPRGIGANWLPCFICGEKNGGNCQPDMASFVENRAAGLRVQAMFVEARLEGTLDYRPSEPNWVQFKLGACERHLPILKRLGILAVKNGRIITPQIIAEAMEEESQ